jgi:tetratricopeptide (TPR) repeat protein
MLAKISVERALIKARSLAKKGEFLESQKLYQAVLLAFPKNKRAQDELANLNKPKLNNANQNPPQEVVNQLVNFYNQGELLAVVEQAQALTEQYPDAFIIWNILGASSAQLGMLDEAIKSYEKSILIKPDYADVYNNLGNALKAQGRLVEAIEAYNQVLTINPDHADAYNNMGILLKDQGNFVEAIEAFKQAIKLKFNNFEAYSNMGNALKAQGRFVEAIEANNQAISIKPDYADAYINVGLILKDQGKLDEGIAAYKKALSLKANNAEAFINMGNAFNDQGRLEEAIEAYKQAIKIKPDYAECYSNMGLTLHDQGKLAEAIEAYKQAIKIKPDYAECYSNMGLTLHDQGKLAEAIEAYKQAIKIKPDYAEAHLNLSFTLLQSSNIKQGLDEYEWRWKTSKGLERQRCFLQPLWNGQTSLKDKRILLWSEQGIGDTINWASCLPLVSSQSKHCIVECQEKLVPLLARSFPNIEIKAVNKSKDLERDDFDYHLPMGSLYKCFIDKILYNGKVDSYLIPDPVRVDFWKERLNSIGKGPYIGISWKSSVVSTFRTQHYPSISEWFPVLKIPEVTFINLQYKNFADDMATVQDEFGVTVHNFDDLDQYGNISDVSALCAALDMVVSTKVTPPFISSAVGTSTKIANWRQSNYNNILNNPVTYFFDMFHKDTWESWGSVFNLIAEDILRLKHKTSCCIDKLKEG